MEKKENLSSAFEPLLDDWQKEVLKAEGDILLCTGRRVGKTYIFARKAAERMVSEPSTAIVAVSLTEDQAFLMHSMVLYHLEHHYKSYLKVAKKLKPTKNKIHLNNGSSYQVRPVGNTGDAIRGFNADILIVDEASRIPKTAWDAAKPTLLTTGGDIWLCSTPAMKEGYFWDSWKEAVEDKDPDARFKVFHISSEEVIHNRVISHSWTLLQREKAIRILEREKKEMTEISYGREYLGQFMDNLMRWYTDDWIDKVCTLQKPAQVQKGDFFLGVDIARLGGDETSFEIIQKIDKDNYIHVYNETHTHWLTTQTEDRIVELDRQYSFKKIYIDAGSGSLGVGIFDQLMRKDQTKRKTEALNNRKIVLDRYGKATQRFLGEDMHENLRALGERGFIKLLDNDNVRASLRSVIFEFSKQPQGISKLRISGSYTHIAEGLKRAAMCSKEKHLNFLITSFKI